MRRSLLIAVVALAALTACSTNSEDDADTTTTAAGSSDTTAAAAASDDPRAPGLTDTEIKVGITYVDLSNLHDILGIDQGDWEAAYNAVIDDVNANGGVNGRTLVPSFSPIDPLGTDAEAAACTKLTQDDPVFVVVGFVLTADNALCYLETNGTALLGGTMSEERLARADAPWFTTEGSDDTAVDGVRLLAESGRLDGSVAVVGVVGDEALYDTQIQPVLEEAGIEPVDVAYVDTSIPDPNVVGEASQTLAERFDADGADTVLMIGGGVGGFFPTGLAATDFRPTLIFSQYSNATLYATGDGNDLSVLGGALATGGYDASDDFAELGGVTEDCVQIMTDAGLELTPKSEVPEGEPTQIDSSLPACRQIALLVAILEAAGPDLDYGAFRAAGEGLGDIDLAGSPDPWHFGPPPSADGDQPVYVYEWNGTDLFTVQDA